MQNRTKEAIEYFKNGHNCAQAVLCAYAEDFGISHEEAYRVAEGFGGGIGGTRDHVCGAVSGAILAASMIQSDGSAGGKTKSLTYKTSREIMNDFENKNTTVICRELFGAPGQGKIRSCTGCVKDASEILYSVLNNK